MKCVYCNADLDNGSNVCSYCGREQNIGGNNNYQMYNNPQMNNKKSKGVIYIIIGVLVLFLVLVIGVLIFVLNKNKSDEYKYYGKWKCNDGSISLEIDSKHFNMENSSLTVEANYEVEYEEKSGPTNTEYTRYGLIVDATKRIIEGTEYNEPYKTQYEIVMEDGLDNEMSMMNSISYSLYQCVKEK